MLSGSKNNDCNTNAMAKEASRLHKKHAGISVYYIWPGLLSYLIKSSQLHPVKFLPPAFYQFALSQPSSVEGAWLLPPFFPLPSASQWLSQFSQLSLLLFLLLEGVPDPHTSQLSELFLSAWFSGNVQLSPLGDLVGFLISSELPNVSQNDLPEVAFW